MSKTANTKVGDTIFSLINGYVVEWEIIATNPKNDRFFIIQNKESDQVIKQVHWKTLEYGGDYTTFFSLTKTDLLFRFKTYTALVINSIGLTE
jgi:hypothetical protein